ncbi:MAG: hypothetical protein RLZZ303_1194 [Candidatus Hydrogenedentota bacterium]
MAMPNVGAHPRRIENLRVGGGYASAPDGGLDIDAAGNLATNGDLTVAGDGQVLGLLGLGTPITLQVQGGAIGITQSHHLIDTEGLAASDDLDTINGGRIGDVLVLRSVSTSRKTTIKDNTGNIRCGGDFQLGNTSAMIVLLLEDNGWKCLCKLAN